MSRDTDRPSRRDPYQEGAEDSLYTDSPSGDAPQPRRRRSQAARIRMEETGSFDDTLVPRAREREERPIVRERPVQQEPAAPRGRPVRRPVEDDIDELYDAPDARRDRDADSVYARPAPKGERRPLPRYMDDDDDYDEADELPVRKRPRGGDVLGEQYPDYTDLYDDEDEPPRKRHILRWVILAVVILALLACVTFFWFNWHKPAEDTPQPVLWVRELINPATPTPEPLPTATPTVPPTPSPSPAPDPGLAQVIGFLPDPSVQPDVNAPITFRVTTTAHTDRLQIVNDNGEVLYEGGSLDYVDIEYGREWNLRIYFTGPYSGNVEAYPGNEGGWNEAGGARISIKVGEDTPAEPTQAPAGQGSDTGTAAGFAAAGAQATSSGVVALAVDIQGQAYDSYGAVDTFERAHPIDFANAENYKGENGMNGVLTFRGSSMRQNAAVGVVNPTENKLETLWTADAGIASDGANAFSAQPLIVQWHANIREIMELNADKVGKGKLREVIFAGNDGNIYFYDIDDGTPTRDPIQLNPAMPMLGTPSVYPFGYPMLTVGSGDPADLTMEGSTGLLIYNLLKNSYGGSCPGENVNALSTNRTVITSALFDNSSDSIVGVVGNGMIYSMFLDTTIDGTQRVLGFKPTVDSFRSGTEGEDTSVDSSFAAYGGYAYYATNGGILQCIDLNSYTPVWGLNVGADTDAAIALAETADGVALYHATKADIEGFAHLRKINAEDGTVIWDVQVPGSISASPLVGTGVLDGTVYVAAVNSELGGTVYAIQADTGEITWETPSMVKHLASPVALYSETDKAWILQGDEGGLMLLDAATGQQVDYLELDGPVYGSPAAFDDMIVVATETGKIHGIQLK